MSSPLPPPASPKPRQLIYSYYIESSNIKNVFQALLESYLSSRAVLKLNSKATYSEQAHEDEKLREKLIETAVYVYPIRLSTIGADLEMQRYFAYKQSYGYVIAQKESVVANMTEFNSKFNETFEAIMKNIMLGVLQVVGTVTEKTADPDGLAQLLDSLRSQIIENSYNETYNVAQYWNVAYERLLALLDDDNLMKTQLGIQTGARDVKLQQLGTKLGVAVSEYSKFLFDLAERMEFFLQIILEEPNWNATKAGDLYKEEIFFKAISNDWKQVYAHHKDFLNEALITRPIT